MELSADAARRLLKDWYQLEVTHDRLEESKAQDDRKKRSQRIADGCESGARPPKKQRAESYFRARTFRRTAATVPPILSPLPPKVDGAGWSLLVLRENRVLGPNGFFVFSSRIPNSFESHSYGPD
jgi:hypothetical protein